MFLFLGRDAKGTGAIAGELGNKRPDAYGGPTVVAVSRKQELLMIAAICIAYMVAFSLLIVFLR